MNKIYEKIKNDFKAILNPNTRKSIVDENRLVEVQEEGEKLKIVYRRDGITPLQKKEMEAEMLTVLKNDYDLDNVFLKTISERSEEVYNSIPKQQPGEMSEAKPGKADPAQLKVGHGTIGQKKRIPGVDKVIAVASGKGGVGKSTFTVNLARSLANNGKKVGVIDADIYGPSIPTLLGMKDATPHSNNEKKIIPVDAHQLKFISFGLFINEDDAVIWRGPMLGGVLNQFFFDVDWTGLDYLIIDLPPGTGDVQLSMVQSIEVDGSIIISTPQDVAMSDARRGLEMFNKLKIPVTGLVENMSSFICDSCDKEHRIFGDESLESKAKKLNIPYLGEIPLEPGLRASSDEGVPFMSNEKFRGSRTWDSYVKITEKVVSH